MDKSRKSKDKRQEMKENAHWQKAHCQAVQCGITLTKRKNSKGDYVCYLSKKSRNLLSCLWDKKKRLNYRYCSNGCRTSRIIAIRSSHLRYCCTGGASSAVIARTGWVMWSVEDGWVCRWRVISHRIAGIWSYKTLSKVLCEHDNLGSS